VTFVVNIVDLPLPGSINALKSALIVYGGWDGHQPKEVAEIFGECLPKKASTFAFWIRWTRGTIESGKAQPDRAGVNSRAVEAGAAERGVRRGGPAWDRRYHDGMCDAFRNSCEYQFMTGGQWVASRNDGVRYTIKMGPTSTRLPKASGIAEVASEQYYMHVDPAVKVLATTHFPVSMAHVGNGDVEMPIV
jgi:type 1 glutamine amidotransferase